MGRSLPSVLRRSASAESSSEGGVRWGLLRSGGISWPQSQDELFEGQRETADLLPQAQNPPPDPTQPGDARGQLSPGGVTQALELRQNHSPAVPEAHPARRSCFKYFGKSLGEREVAILHRHPESGLQALDGNCQGDRGVLC